MSSTSAARIRHVGHSRAQLAVVGGDERAGGGTSARRSGWPRSTWRTRAPTGSARGSGGTRRGSARASAATRRSVRECRRRRAARRPRRARRPSSGRAPRSATGSQRVPRDGEPRVADAQVRKRGSPNMSGFWSAMPIVSAPRRAPRGRAGRRPRGRGPERASIGRAGVGRKSAAAQRLRGARCPRGSRRARSSTAVRAGPAPVFHSLCTVPGGMTAQSPGSTSRSIVAHAQPAAAGGEEVELLGLRGGSAPSSRRRRAPSPRRGSGCAPASTRDRRSRGSSSRRAS